MGLLYLYYKEYKTTSKNINTWEFISNQTYTLFPSREQIK
jgi:hypothetical protein